MSVYLYDTERKHPETLEFKYPIVCGTEKMFFKQT